MDIKIIKGPPVSRYRGELKETLEAMPPDSHFVIPKALTQNIRYAAYSLNKALGFTRYRIKTIDGETVCWRLKHDKPFGPRKNRKEAGA